MMRGGFTFKLTERKDRPAIQIKHLSRRASMIRFTAPGKQRAPRGQRRRNIEVQPHRGCFVDIKTLAAALTSRSFSLASLGEFLGVSSGKLETEEHGGPLTEDYLAYALRDVQTTWECFLALRERYLAHGLTDTPLHAIYSEAGLGKAYLKQMGIRPWQDMPSTMPPELIGAIVSSYFGGRSEVHIRREIRQVAYCDFLSMYPTVCVLMGLWRFVIAKGVTWVDATAETRALLERVTVSDLQRQDFWRSLTTLVEIAPGDDFFPVRAKYGSETHYTIGLNHLSSKTSLWFTLADCIAAKVLTGKIPKIVKAIRFAPGDKQEDLSAIAIAGRPEYQVDPVGEDFYRRLIDLRTATKMAMKSVSGGERDQLDAAQMALKILANSTSYGIFFELNVEELADQIAASCYARGESSFTVEIDQSETPGRYFHPLLATLITGAARLMLAITERLALDAGLDWVFCDTDSLAIAKPSDMDSPAFFEAVDRVRGWFDPLNPYDKKGPILKLEEANFCAGKHGDSGQLEPLYCFAVSSKRYAIFNVDGAGQPIIRKASAHGLGHLVAPYGEQNAPRAIPAPIVPLNEIGVERWQHDVWYRIVTAVLEGHPAQVFLNDLPGFNQPAVSHYAATTPTLLRWFRQYNHGKPYRQQVRPFGFMLAFMARKLMELVDAPIPNAAEAEGKTKRRATATRKAMDAPRAIAPFDRDLIRAAKSCFDRNTGKPVNASHLKTHAQALLRYHLHPEAKFEGGDYTDAGVTRRRHIAANGIQLIGKEANRWEEQFHLGADPEAQSEYGMQPETREQVMATIRDAVERHSLRAVAQAGHVRKHLLSQAIKGAIALPDAVINRLAAAVVKLDQKDRKRREREAGRIAELRERVQREGLRKVATQINISAGYLSRKMNMLVPTRYPVEGSAYHADEDRAAL